MEIHDLETLKKAVEQALHNGWLPTNRPIEGVDVLLTPPSVVLRVTPISRQVDDNLYFRWFDLLLDPEWAKKLWGEKLYKNYPVGYQVAWRFHQHELLTLLQTAGTGPFFEYLEETMKL